MKRPEKRTVIFFILILVILLIAMITAVRLNVGLETIEKLIDRINSHTPTPIFIALLLVVPIFGFPLSPFLMVLGLKFHFITGAALMALVIPIHLFISFLLAGLIGKIIKKILSGRGYGIPRVPPNLYLRFSFLVAVTPVAPYAIKNYLLPLAGIPFRTYLGISWPSQFLLALPMIAMGNSIADMNPALFGAAVIAMVIIYLIINGIEKKYGERNRSENDGERIDKIRTT